MSQRSKRKQSESRSTDSSEEQEASIEESFTPQLPSLRTLLQGTTDIPRNKQSLSKSESEKKSSVYSTQASVSLPAQLAFSQAAPSAESSKTKQVRMPSAAQKPYTEVYQLISESPEVRQFPFMSHFETSTLSTEKSGVTSPDEPSVKLSFYDEEERTLVHQSTGKRNYPLPMLHQPLLGNKPLSEQRVVTYPVEKTEQPEPLARGSSYSETKRPFFSTTQAHVSSLSELQQDVGTSKMHSYNEEEEQGSGPSSTNVSSAQLLELLRSKGKRNLTEEERKTLKILRNRLSAEKSRQRQRERMAELTKQIHEYEQVLKEIRTEANALLRYVERLEAFCRLTGIPDHELQRPNLRYLPG
ncbi:hypothetical protein GAYE_SCF00G1669 [Galdieria yellowstonensis]|uniref:BZIP domain-containing protein n=1 Tax=Galdieria yellowstonensis TaxID=3028027 RepID=A0AAV9I8U0_9RHOD|nr:hypothetical protein GAYE_SCF00G1669 [Galdieria yellowstonensis]